MGVPVTPQASTGVRLAARRFRPAERGARTANRGRDAGVREALPSAFARLPGSTPWVCPVYVLFVKGGLLLSHCEQRHQRNGALIWVRFSYGSIWAPFCSKEGSQGPCRPDLRLRVSPAVCARPRSSSACASVARTG